MSPGYQARPCPPKHVYQILPSRNILRHTTWHRSDAFDGEELLPSEASETLALQRHWPFRDIDPYFASMAMDLHKPQLAISRRDYHVFPEHLLGFGKRPWRMLDYRNSISLALHNLHAQCHYPMKAGVTALRKDNKSL